MGSKNGFDSSSRLTPLCQECLGFWRAHVRTCLPKSQAVCELCKFSMNRDLIILFCSEAFLCLLPCAMLFSIFKTIRKIFASVKVLKGEKKPHQKSHTNYRTTRVSVLQLIIVLVSRPSLLVWFK